MFLISFKRKNVNSNFHDRLLISFTIADSLKQVSNFPQFMTFFSFDILSSQDLYFLKMLSLYIFYLQVFKFFLNFKLDNVPFINYYFQLLDKN